MDLVHPSFVQRAILAQVDHKLVKMEDAWTPAVARLVVSMPDAMLTPELVFALKDSLETQNTFVCHPLDLLSVHQDAEPTVIVNTERPTNVFAIQDLLAILTLVARKVLKTWWPLVQR